MNFEQLWAPWRIGYITGGDKPKSPPNAGELAWMPEADRTCFLCRAAADLATDQQNQHQSDRQNLVVYRTKLAVAVLNRYPYNNGHLLVAPVRHVARLDALSNEEHVELMRCISRLNVTLERLMKPEGFNIGLNLGRVAGAGVPGHVHWHIVPRWNGDTNFMPVLAGVNVIPQSLEALMELLHAELDRST
ncbi:MAG TPA: HIT domain-containing protein [Pirellulales bacterium]|jgi:ATP adenylyltransferase|nr:HIT domain-containing protein [Pirellulales bacterium]